nr:MAG TPA: Minor capsid protein [Caudoviricetes sp.]
MATKIKISTPKGYTFQAPNTGASFSWNSDFGPEMTNRFTQAQKYIDSEVLRFCSARVPFQTGMLQKSGVLGTVVGSGEVCYTAPYAAKQYYHTATSRRYDANRGAYWFERGKAAEKQQILRGAKKLAGAG